MAVTMVAVIYVRLRVAGLSSTDTYYRLFLDIPAVSVVVAYMLINRRTPNIEL